MAIFDFLFADTSTKKVRSFAPLVRAVNDLEKDLTDLSDEQIRERSLALRNTIQESLRVVESSQEDDDVEDQVPKNTDETKKLQRVLRQALPEAFALTRVAAQRTLGMRHFDVQLLGAMVLNDGSVAEMKTGEGKTLVSTLAIYLNALVGRGVHVVTVNDYLAKRDAEWMGKVFNFLGLSVGIIIHEKSYVVDYNKKFEAAALKSAEQETEEIVEQQVIIENENLREVKRQEAYAADITYGTNNEFGFDYLKDNMVHDDSERSQRGLFYAVIDEIDSILIDEARTPLIISAPAQESGDMYRQFSLLVPKLAEHTDYTVDEKQRTVSLTDEGIDAMERLLNIKDIYSQGVEIVHHLEQALKAQVLFKKDKDYVVRDGEVVIVDEFTGRMMPGRRYSDGLHQAIEAKEGVEIKRESMTMATITFQNYFRLYQKISGMTGTAMTESEELFRIYKLEVVAIPTHRPRIRTDLPDKIFKSEKGKLEVLVADIKSRHEAGQPVLIGTISIEKNEVLSHMLKINGIPHEVLNAKNHEREAAIISQAGARGAVTVATNMAGRGVDIVLGGHPYSPEKADAVKAAGGLAVFGTERHESRRIDNQLRGRAGRQGDPGCSQFYISLEDDLMRIFGGDRIKNMMTSLGIPDEQPIENKIVSRSIETAQKRVEGHNFDIRKHVLEYDDVMNRQRATIYAKRNRILTGTDEYRGSAMNLNDMVIAMADAEFEAITMMLKNAETLTDELREQVTSQLSRILPPSSHDKLEAIKTFAGPQEMEEYILQSLRPIVATYRSKLAGEFSPEFVSRITRDMYLRVIDSYWVRHLTAIDHLRTGIGLVGYGQKDPLVEYKHRAYDLFQRMLVEIDAQFVRAIMNVQIEETQ